MLALAAAALAAVVSPDPCKGSGWCVENPKVPAQAIRGFAGTEFDNLWAYGDPAVLLHWNGADWSPVDLGAPDRIVGMAMFGHNDVWVATESSVRRWDGVRWVKPEQSSKKPLAAIWGSGAGRLWLLGADLQKWDGHRFAVVEGVLEEGDSVFSVSGTREDDVWALGSGRTGEGLVFHWNGKKWSRERLPASAQAGAIRADALGVWWVAGGKLFRRGQKEWEPVTAAPGASALSPATGGPLIVAGPGTLWHADELGLERLPPLDGRVLAVWASTAADVWAGGQGGLLRHFDGRQWSPGGSVTYEPLVAVSGSGADNVWAVTPTAHAVRRKAGTWTALPDLPGKAPMHATDVWTASPDDAWVVGPALCAHWDGRVWRAVPTLASAQSIWGRSAKDVWAAGSALMHWDGQKWGLVTEPQVGWLFTDVIGNADHLWVLARGPRPEYGGGRTTGQPDDVLEIQGTEQRSLGYPARPSRLALLRGGIWAVDSQLRRYEQDGWLPTRPAFGAAVDAGGTLLTLMPDGFAWARGKLSGAVRGLPGNLSDLWTDGTRAWAVGSDGLIVRIEAAALH